MKKLNSISHLHKLLHNRIIDISFSENLSHLSSCITTLPILVPIYKKKQSRDLVILSNGHAGLAQYVCLEFFENKNAIELLHKHGIHPSKDIQNNIFCSTGSLGLGLPLALGAALADQTRHVYCVISDGECCEGSIWESLYFMSKHNVPNITVFVNANGISAYSYVSVKKLKKIINSFELKSSVKCINTEKYIQAFPELFDKGIESHYCRVTNKQTLTYEI